MENIIINNYKCEDLNNQEYIIIPEMSFNLNVLENSEGVLSFLDGDISKPSESKILRDSNGRFLKGHIVSKKLREHLKNLNKGKHPLKEFKKGNIPWNINLTKETDERVKNYGLKGSLSQKGKSKIKTSIGLKEFHRLNSPIRKCKYCDKPAKINYWGIKRLHKGYYKTCGNKECLNIQYQDIKVNNKKKYINRNINISCKHCGNIFLKESFNQKWCKECVPNGKAREFMQRYNLNKKEYLDFINKNNGICLICNKNKGKVIDHCHKTKKVRGFICQHCNTALNLIENEQSLKRALKYIGAKYNFDIN